MASAPRCSIVTSPGVGTVGIASSIYFQAHDSYNNKILTGGDIFLAEITDPKFARTIVVPADLNDGMYRLTFASSVTGRHNVTITLGGSHIFGSPLSMLIDSGALDLAGRNGSFTIVAKDEYSNNLTRGGDPFIFWLIYTNPVIRMNQTVHDLQNGLYQSYFVLTAAGIYNVEIRLAGSHISGSPFTVLVDPASVDP
ncbi:hypothetical protein GUITHDRAFT_72200, partial [Guillardia theta CCMP2712]